MSLRHKVYTTRNEKVLDFVIGFVGWFLVNGLLYTCSIFLLQFLAFETTSSILGLLLGVLPLLINIGALIYFAFTRRWIAFGILAAIALVLVGVLLLGLVFYVICYNQGMFK
ncbi:MAG TPA: hypothetical protein VKE41_19165 [Roseiflexaceae bacterium]|nr:hypothetical protein [Roseiflexaceae bacterium]